MDRGRDDTRAVPSVGAVARQSGERVVRPRLDNGRPANTVVGHEPRLVGARYGVENADGPRTGLPGQLRCAQDARDVGSVYGDRAAGIVQLRCATYASRIEQLLLAEEPVAQRVLEDVSTLNEKGRRSRRNVSTPVRFTSDGSAST